MAFQIFFWVTVAMLTAGGMLDWKSQLQDIVHIYTSGELNCSGIARALKYCYSFSGILNVFSKFFSRRRSVFTLSILKVTQTLFVRQFTVTKVIDISSAPTLDKCSPWSDGFLCCDTESLHTDQLEIPISKLFLHAYSPIPYK